MVCIYTASDQQMGCGRQTVLGNTIFSLVFIGFLSSLWAVSMQSKLQLRWLKEALHEVLR